MATGVEFHHFNDVDRADAKAATEALFPGYYVTPSIGGGWNPKKVLVVAEDQNRVELDITKRNLPASSYGM